MYEADAQAAPGGGHVAQGGEETRRKGEDHERVRSGEAAQAGGERAAAREEEELVQNETGQDQVNVAIVVQERTEIKAHQLNKPENDQFN